MVIIGKVADEATKLLGITGIISLHLCVHCYIISPCRRGCMYGLVVKQFTYATYAVPAACYKQLCHGTDLKQFCWNCVVAADSISWRRWSGQALVTQE